MITVLGPILRGDGSVFIGRMKLAPLWTPAAINGAPVINAVVTVNCVAPGGGFAVVGGDPDTLTLSAGTWRVTFPSAPEVDAIYLAAPDADVAMAFADLMVAGASEEAVIDPRYGHGSPEGIVTASMARLYWDMDAKEFWIKDTAGGNVGWRRML
jgi:hypothetical protein